MASSEVNLRIRLNINNTTKDSKVRGTATVWNPAECLDGYVEISSMEDLTIDEITIYFEG